MKRKSVANTTPSKKKKGLSQEETKIIETGIGDYEKCARAYFNNVIKNAGCIKFEGHGTIQPIKKNKMYSSDTKSVTTFEDLQKAGKIKKLKLRDNYVSNMFECVFSNDGKLNRDIIQEGAIVRIWSVGARELNNETHSTVTIDYKDRRVSFGSSYSQTSIVLLNNKKVGYKHIINSPEEELVKKVLYNANSKKVENIRLVAMGYLTEKHIQNLNELLVKNATDFSLYTEPSNDAIFVQSSSDKLFYPITSTNTYSTNLFYNRLKLYGVLDKNELKIKELDEPGKKSKKNMQSINCAEFMILLFSGIVCINSSHKFVSLSQIVTASGPPSLIPNVAYKCVADNNYTLSEPSMFDYKIGKSLLCNYIGLPKFISMIVFTALYFGASATLVLPLSYTPYGWTDFISNAVVTTALSTALAALTSIKLYTNIGGTSQLKFGFDNKKIKIKEKLVSLFGVEDTNMFIDMANRNMFIDIANRKGTSDTDTEDTSTTMEEDTSTAGTMEEDTSTAGTMEEDTSTAGTMEDTMAGLENKFSSFGFKKQSRRRSRRRSRRQSRRHSSKKQSRRRSRRHSSKKQSRRHSSKKQSRRQSRRQSSKKQSRRHSSKRQSRRQSSKKQSKKQSRRQSRRQSRI